MRLLAIFIFSFCILGCNHPESSNYNRENSLRQSNDEKKLGNNDIKNRPVPSSDTSTTYKVIGVKDGDTFELLVDNSPLVVRFAHIDCPEKKQPFGQKAKQFVSDICFGKYVSLKHNNKYDRNHRLIAEIILEDGTNLNKLLIENGFAWHFKKYSKDEEYSRLENEAKLGKKGLWADENPIPPWIWRK